MHAIISVSRSAIYKESACNYRIVARYGHNFIIVCWILVYVNVCLFWDSNSYAMSALVSMFVSPRVYIRPWFHSLCRCWISVLRVQNGTHPHTPTHPHTHTHTLFYSLSFNPIGDTGLTALIRVIERCESLGWLRLQQNCLTDRSINLLIELIKSSKSLSRLDIR